MVHASSERCPFGPVIQQGPIGTPCCVLYAEPTRKNLIAFDQDALAEDMEDDLSCDHAIELGHRLRAYLRLAEERFTRDGKLHARVTSFGIGSDNIVRPIARAVHEEALQSIRFTEHWYREIGNRGYGVKTQWR